ncbi:MAG: hypothetical protein HYS13_16825 [Planctomycetia bacterium]|nr:hypothetical protein [Planctomycetia bacterium]
MSQPRSMFCVLVAGLFAVASFASAPPASAEDAYYNIARKDLPLDGDKWPADKYPGYPNWPHYAQAQAMTPRIVIDGQGEAYINPPDVHVWNYDLNKGMPLDTIVLRAPEGRDVVGTLYIPKSTWSGMHKIRFRVPATMASEEAKRPFYRTKAGYAQYYFQRGIAGSAWFRRQYNDANNAIDVPNERETQRPDGFRGGIDDTFEVFSGGRAISENLQLNRQLFLSQDAADDQTVPIESLQGITIAEIEWKSLLMDEKTKLDPLAASVPHDQHAIFFPTFQGMLDVMDEAERLGGPLAVMAETRTEDAGTKERYQTQLCLETTAISRLLGPRVISSVAATGSDPYLRTGSDTAVLFQSKNAAVFLTFIRGKHAAAIAGPHKAKAVKGQVAGVSYEGAVSPGRRVCSYLAALDDVIVVSNSLFQLEQIIKVDQGKSPSLASLDEYRFFRQRYEMADGESAFLMLSDAAIRRWCSPKWRIGNSRRTRAAALLADIQAEHHDDLVARAFKDEPVEYAWKLPQFGRIELAEQGATSSVYGSLEFMTPIAELSIEKVTPAEAEAYNRWRDQYQQLWRMFDPIGAQVSVGKEKTSADVTILPLIIGSEYTEFARVIGSAEIKGASGDPHKEALFHFVLALDRETEGMKRLEELVRDWVLGGDLEVDGKKVSALSWMGETFAVYLDADPIWAELAKADDPWQWLREHDHQIPIAISIESADREIADVFCRTLGKRGLGGNNWRFVEAEYEGQKFYAVGPQDDIQFYLAATPKALIISLEPNILKRAIDREKNGPKGTPAQPLPKEASAWLGKHLAGKITPHGLAILEGVFGRDYLGELQARSWGNLPILNEWKRRYPNEHPVTLHQRLWQARLTCPGGGKYVWNEKWQTMESTAFGHPGEPKRPDPSTVKFLPANMDTAFGLSFEFHKGLRPTLPPGAPPPREPVRAGEVMGLRARVELQKNGK